MWGLDQLRSLKSQIYKLCNFPVQGRRQASALGSLLRVCSTPSTLPPAFCHRVENTQLIGSFRQVAPDDWLLPAWATHLLLEASPQPVTTPHLQVSPATGPHPPQQPHLSRAAHKNTPKINLSNIPKHIWHSRHCYWSHLEHIDFLTILGFTSSARLGQVAWNSFPAELKIHAFSIPIFMVAYS